MTHAIGFELVIVDELEFAAIQRRFFGRAVA